MSISASLSSSGGTSVSLSFCHASSLDVYLSFSPAFSFVNLYDFLSHSSFTLLISLSLHVFSDSLCPCVSVFLSNHLRVYLCYSVSVSLLPCLTPSPALSPTQCTVHWTERNQFFTPSSTMHNFHDSVNHFPTPGLSFLTGETSRVGVYFPLFGLFLSLSHPVVQVFCFSAS